MSRAARRAPFRQRLKRTWEVLLDLMALGGGTGTSYKGAAVNRAHPGGPGLRAADQEIWGDMRALRARARDVRRNSPYVQQYLNLELTNVLGGPDQPDHQARVLRADGEPDEEINDAIEDGFRRWARRPVTVDGRQSLAQFRRLQLETWRVDGEAFTRLVRGPQFPHGLALQAIDPDLVDEKLNRPAGREGPEIRMGVEVDPDGRPLGYWAWNRPEFWPANVERRLVRYDASEVLHHFRPRRANQTRGVSELAAVILDLMDIDGLDEAVIVGARAAARQLAIVYWQDQNAGTPPDPGDAEARKPRDYTLDDTSVLELDPGQRADPFVPQQPQSVYPAFIKTRVRRLGCGLGVSYAALSNDLEAVNYGSMRGGALIERDVWRMKQDDWNTSFEVPVHEAWLKAALLTGALRLPSRDWRRYADVEIESRGWDWVDPRNDAETASLEIGLGLTSRTRIHRKRGTQFAKVAQELEREARVAREMGLDVAPKAAVTAPARPAGGESDPDAGPAGDAPDEDGGGQRANRVRAAIANGRAH